MNKSITCTALVLLGLFASCAWASDGEKIDRSIAKEPSYQSGAPKYGLLTLGRAGKTHVWLVFDSVPDPLRPGGNEDYLYVDRNGNGDLTEEGERVAATVLKRKIFSSIGKNGFYDQTLLEFPVGEIKDGEGTIYKDVKVMVQWFSGRDRPCTIYASPPGRGTERTEFHQLVFATSPQDAPVLRFGGALTMRFALGMTHALSLTEKFNLQGEIGSIGIGPGSFVFMLNDAFPKALHPLAEIQWPHREAGQPPIKMSVTLDQRC
jgi:hypothetical protein